MNLWKLITADLERACQTLPTEAAFDGTILEYQDFIDHNELELACDMLEAYAEEHPVTRDFWLALLDAADKMHLSVNVERFRNRARTA